MNPIGTPHCDYDRYLVIDDIDEDASEILTVVCETTRFASFREGDAE